MFFENAQKVTQFFGYFSNKIWCQEFSKMLNLATLADQYLVHIERVKVWKSANEPTNGTEHKKQLRQTKTSDFEVRNFYLGTRRLNFYRPFNSEKKINKSDFYCSFKICYNLRSKNAKLQIKMVPRDQLLLWASSRTTFPFRCCSQMISFLVTELSFMQTNGFKSSPEQ